jgi:hypothetical protein
MAIRNLSEARRNKEDEFYTQLSDIETELYHYKKHFKGKTILCNCDDPYESNFFKYFAMRFDSLGLKKLIATSYSGSPVVGGELRLFDVEYLDKKGKNSKKPFKLEIAEVGDANADGAVGLADVEYLIKNKKNTLTLLEEGGDFRSDECVELLKEADIVVTNPPFSLFREYVAQLIKYKKKFIIIGNQNVVTYKEIFPLLKANKMWLGYYSGDMAFTVPAHYEERETRFWIDKTGQKWRSMGNICWLTNLDIPKRHEELTLYKRYTPKEYPKYDNYYVIEVSKVADIPYNYDGVMGVPITFLNKHNPDQFEILGVANSARWIDYECFTIIEGKRIYNRIIIKRKGKIQ